MMLMMMSSYLCILIFSSMLISSERLYQASLHLEALQLARVKDEEARISAEQAAQAKAEALRRAEEEKEAKMEKERKRAQRSADKGVKKAAATTTISFKVTSDGINLKFSHIE